MNTNGLDKLIDEVYYEVIAMEKQEFGKNWEYRYYDKEQLIAIIEHKQDLIELYEKYSRRSFLFLTGTGILYILFMIDQIFGLLK